MEKITKSLNSVLIKPAGPDCNMACRYCFYLEKKSLFSANKIHRMSESILEETVRQVMAQTGGNISFGWQGGEPTLMGIPFFEKAVELQKQYGRGHTIGNGLQTNGILIDDEWVQFLNKYNFLVGLSLDGPEHIHNRYRMLQGGQNSWEHVVKSAKRMLDGEVAVNALIVVNDYSVQFPEEIYKFHKKQGLTYMQFIPCVETDPANSKQAAPFSVSAEEYGNFLCILFDLWISDFVDEIPTTSIRQFDSIFYHYVNMRPPDCTLLSECGIYVVVEHNGNIYSCDFFVEPEWKLGNIMKDNLSELLNSDKQYKFGKLKSKIPGPCKDCEWLQYCCGGCTKDRIKDPRDQKLNHFCLSYKNFFKHADSKYKELAETWEKQQMKNKKRHAILSAIERGEISVNRNDLCPCKSGKKFKRCCGIEY
jgi:uncharacterized protein